jgi:hypothetical protein
MCREHFETPRKLLMNVYVCSVNERISGVLVMIGVQSEPDLMKVIRARSTAGSFTCLLDRWEADGQ